MDGRAENVEPVKGTRKECPPPQRPNRKDMRLQCTPVEARPNLLVLSPSKYMCMYIKKEQHHVQKKSAGTMLSEQYTFAKSGALSFSSMCNGTP